MAVLALAAAGAATGAAIGGTFLGVTAASWGWMAGSMLGNALFGGTKSQGPRLGDLKFTGTEYGQPVPWVAGAPRISGQVVWASTKRELAKTESVGKGGGSEYTSYTYEIDLLILLAENATTGLSRVWSNGELVYGGGERADLWADLIVYTGAADQLPDPTYEAAVGLGNAPAYRGRTTVLIRGLQLGNSGQLPNLTFEVGTASTSPTDSGEYFYVDFNNATPADRACTSRVASFAATTGTTWAYASGKAVVDVNGWLFDDVLARGIYWNLTSSPTVSSPVVYDFVFSASTAPSGPTKASTATLAYVCPSASGANATWAFYIGCTFSAAGLVSAISVNFQLVGTISHTLASPSAGPLRITVHVDPVTPRTRVFLDETQIGEFPGIPSNLLASSTVLLGGSTNAADKTGTIKATVEYDLARIISSPAAAIMPLQAPVCSVVNVGQTIPVPLQTVVDQLMTRAGYQPDEWDSSDLAAETRPVRAMALAQVGTTRAALETLASAYFFHASKGDQIVLRRRASATPAAIGWADLATAEDATAQGEPFALNTGSDMEVPAQIALTYPNMAGDYNPATEHSARLLGAQDSTQAVQLGLGLLPAEAKLVADALLFDQVTAMVTASISLPPPYGHLQAGDVLLVPDGRGRTHRMLVDKRTDTALVAQLDLRQDDPTAFESEAITDTGYALSDSVRQLAPTWWQVLDVPLLRDGDNAPGYYVAMAPNKAAPNDIWRGAVFVRAWLPEQWETVATTDQAATLGATTSALPAWDGRNLMDESTVLTVRVSGQLASTTREALQADRTVNVLLIGSEVLRFRQADLLGTTDGENDYRLTGLLRAQLGTDWAATAGAASGARVVLLGAALRRVTDQASQVGTPAEVKAVSQGLLLSSATAQAFTNTAVCLRPLAPVHLRAARAGGDLAITWQRRTRLGHRYGGAVGISVPLGEETEAYRVQLYSGATLLRTLDATTPAATYTAAQQAADGLASGAAITLQVVQRSAAVGDGYPATLATATP